jgi:hypothetical protein
MSSRFVLLVISLTVVATTPICAQDASVLSAGTRVRIVTPALDEAHQTGRVVAATRDTIIFRSDAFPVTRSFAVSDVSAIEISAGNQTHRGRDALYGLGIGGPAGALAGSLAYKKPQPNCWFICETRGGDAVAGALFGGVVGTIVGAFIVGSFDATERWVTIKDSGRLSIAPSNGRLALNYKF